VTEFLLDLYSSYKAKIKVSADYLKLYPLLNAFLILTVGCY
jgi:hypothetical protein